MEESSQPSALGAVRNGAEYRGRQREIKRKEFLLRTLLKGSY